MFYVTYKDKKCLVVKVKEDDICEGVFVVKFYLYYEDNWLWVLSDKCTPI